MLENLYDVIEKISPFGAIEAKLASGLRKRLTRRTCTEDIMRWDRFDWNFSNIPFRGQSKILKVKIAKSLINFTGEHTLVPQLFEGNVEATQAGK